MSQVSKFYDAPISTLELAVSQCPCYSRGPDTANRSKPFNGVCILRNIVGAILVCLTWFSDLSAQTSFYQGKQVTIGWDSTRADRSTFGRESSRSIWRNMCPAVPPSLSRTWREAAPSSQPTTSIALPSRMVSLSVWSAQELLAGIGRTKRSSVRVVQVQLDRLRGRKRAGFLSPRRRSVQSPGGSPCRRGARQVRIYGSGNRRLLFSKVSAGIFGLKIAMVPGYQSSPEANLAIERGEVLCRAGSVQAFFGTEPSRTWSKTGFVRALAQSGRKRYPNLPDVPTIWELMDKHKIGDADRQLAKFSCCRMKSAVRFSARPPCPWTGSRFYGKLSPG